MTIPRLAVITAALSSIAASAAWGQAYQFEVEAKLYELDADEQLPEEIEFSTIGSFERTEIEFAGQEPAYGEDHWGKTELARDKTDLKGPLVYYYDVHKIEAMKQRVAEADVVDEKASFPVPRSSDAACASFWIGCGGRIRISSPPPRKSDEGLTVKAVEQPKGRSRYDDMPSGAKTEENCIEVNYTDSELLGVVP